MLDSHYFLDEQLATQCMKECKRSAIQSQKVMKETPTRARRLCKEMQVYWKRFEKVEKEHRKRAEKEALEQRKMDHELAEVRDTVMSSEINDTFTYQKFPQPITSM